MARRVLISDAAIRKDDSIASPIVRLLAHAPLELRLNARTVFRVNPVKPEWRPRDVLTRLNGVRTLNLRRALDDVRCQIVPPASGPTEPLHLEQEGLASSQRLLGHLSVVDVGLQNVPTRDAVASALRPDGPKLKPSIRAIRAPQAVFVSSGWPVAKERSKRSNFRGQIVRMDHVAGLPLFRFGKSAVVVIQRGPVDQFELAGHRMDDSKQGRNVVEDRAEPALALRSTILGLLPLLDVGDQVAPPDDRAILRAHRYGMTMEPAIHAVRTTQPVVRFEGLPAFDGMFPLLDHHRAIGFVDERRPVLKLFEADTQVVEQLAIGEIDLSGWSHRVHQGWDAVQNEAQVALGSAAASSGS